MPDSDDAKTSRRGALSALVVAGSAIYAGALAVPAYRYLHSDASGASGERWIRVGRLDSLPEGKPTRLTVVGEERDAFNLSRGKLGSVWVTRKGNEVHALSAACPHLGCSIDLGGDAKSFACPCHTSRFTTDGKAEAGPSPRAMDELAARVRDGFVEVDFRRFRQGVGDKVEVG
jgi:cytochrome b6-f complex iron-sulfur subunit/menaquinol-cytochrome c reductase iron-sulfur subunit